MAKDKIKFSELLEYWRENGAPGVIRDEPEKPFMSHHNCKMYDSKSNYRRDLAKDGFVELGDAKPTKPKRDEKAYEQGIADDVKRAMGEL